MSDETTLSTRSRTVTWQEGGAAAAATMSGIEALNAIGTGQIPAAPIIALTGIEAVSITTGDVVFGCVTDACFDNPFGNTHGGFFCTLLDAAAAGAVHTLLAAGDTYTTVEMKVNFLRSLRAGEEVVAHGWVTKPGSTVAFAEADLRRADGELLANATATCLIRRARG